MLRLAVKIILVLVLLTVFVTVFYFGYPVSLKNHSISIKSSDHEFAELKKLQSFGSRAKAYCNQRGFNTSVCFFADMSLAAGKNRFFVYSLEKDLILSSGLVAHGSCNTSFLEHPKFSNTPGSGCSSPGRYKVSLKYSGRFGTAYKLYGLDSSNSNAFKRNIVLHSYYLVPDKEVDPLPVCNSLGCAMVSEKYLKHLSQTIDSSRKPILLWMFDQQ